MRAVGHAAVDNPTRFSLAQLFARDEEGRPLFVALLQASYDVSPRGLLESEPAPAIHSGGELWEPTDPSAGSPDPPEQMPGVVSYRVEPHFAFVKPATDVVLVGHAHARGQLEVSVGLRVGPVSKSLVVRGDRTWVKVAGSIRPTKPHPFQRIPLRWERAFGGWDRRDPDKPVPFWPNPVGLGYHPDGSRFEEGLRLPNLEDPGAPLESWGQVVPSVGFGFTMPNWKPRLGLAGTYDAKWLEDRMPLLPADFDRRFFNAAPAGLVGHLRGDEPVAVTGATAHGQLGFPLPGLRPPQLLCQLMHSKDVLVETRLDTVVIDTDRMRVLLFYRGHTRLKDSPHELETVAIRA
jgi:hypothetical protein